MRNGTREQVKERLTNVRLSLLVEEPGAFDDLVRVQKSGLFDGLACFLQEGLYHMIPNGIASTSGHASEGLVSTFFGKGIAEDMAANDVEALAVQPGADHLTRGLEFLWVELGNEITDLVLTE